MALFFSSLRGLPRFGGKSKGDAIFDKCKNGRQPGARPQTTLFERDPLINTRKEPYTSTAYMRRELL